MRWYELACQLARIPKSVLKNQMRLNDQTRSSLRAIARLHPEIGLLMDDLDAPWNLARRIAHAPTHTEKWQRAEQLLTELIEKRAAADPGAANVARTRLARLIEAIQPDDPVLREALAVDAERYKPRTGAVPPTAARGSG